MNAFASGQTVQLKNANGNAAAQLAVTTDDHNSYTTGTAYNVFGGFGISGFKYIQGFYGANPGPGPNFQASVHLILNAPALVAVIGIGSSQTILTLSGFYDPTIDVPVRSAERATQALIIAHQYLMPGTYTLQETTGDGFPGQTPENEADLIGVFVLSDQPNVATSTSPQIPINVSPTQTPAGPGEQTDHSIPTSGGTGGQIRISSGTGDFSSVSDASNTLNVAPGATLNGTINLSVLNLGHSDAVAPLIYTPSWGDHSSSWRSLSGSVPTGRSQQQARISLVAPTVPGIYHIIFAMCWEIGGDHVASATSWAAGDDIWNDGNDIADFNEVQLSSAQRNGWAMNSDMNGPDSTHPTRWYQPRYYPADAITLTVMQSGVPSTVPPTQPDKGGPSEPPVSGHYVSLARYVVFGVVVLALLGMATIIIRLIMPRRNNQHLSNSHQDQE